MSAPSLDDRYRRWFEYEKDAHRRTLASLEAVPAERRDSPEFRKAVGLFAHIVLARWLWITRLAAATPAQLATAGPPPRSDEEFFPTNVDVSQLRGRLEAMEATWTSFLARLDGAELARVFRYQSLDAGAFQNSVEDVLTQLFGHSWYHRGQIAALVRSLGATPATTDFIYWAREPVPDPPKGS